MTELRYAGTTNWERTIVDGDGKFLRSERVQPGETVEFSDEGAEKILSAPRFMRSFVAVDGPEDVYGSGYGANRFDVQGNTSPYPELDFGSTVQPNRSITRTDQDNPENFALAGANDGPNSDNEELIIREEARLAGQKATAEALKAAQQKRTGTTQAGQKGQGGTTTTSPARADGNANANSGRTGE